MNKQIREAIRRSMEIKNNPVSLQEKLKKREAQEKIMQIKDRTKRIEAIEKNHALFNFDPDAARKALASWKN